jgi:hypothetical protein
VFYPALRVFGGATGFFAAEPAGMGFELTARNPVSRLFRRSQNKKSRRNATKDRLA